MRICSLDVTEAVVFTVPLVLWTSLLLDRCRHCSAAEEEEEVILGTLVNEKSAATAPVWQMKAPSYRVKKALSKRRSAVSLILLLPLLP